MISIPATLTTAQKTASRTPYVELKAYEKLMGTRRLLWTRWYTGSETTQKPHAAVTTTNSLARTYQNAAGNIRLNRVSNPAANSDYATTDLLVAAADCSQTARHALYARGIYAGIAYFNAANTELWTREFQVDYGSVIGTAYKICNIAAGTPSHAAAFYKPPPASKLIVFYNVNAAIYRVYYDYDLAQWVGPNVWPNTITTITGLTCHYAGDFNLVITGTDSSGNSNLWECIYGDGYILPAGVWSALDTLVMRGVNGSNVTYKNPSLHNQDLYRLFVTEEYTGTGAYTHTLASHQTPTTDFGWNYWREPWPVNIFNTYGLAFCGSTSRYFLSTPSGVWTSPITPSPLDLTADLLALDLKLEPRGGTLRATVRNDHAKYLDTASGKASSWIGAQLDLGIGYLCSDGAQAARHLSFWVHDYTLAIAGGNATLTLHASDPWPYLDRWKARRQLTWTAGATIIATILTELLAKAGIHLSNIGNSLLSQTLSPAFTVHPSESLGAAVRRLLAMIPDSLHFQYTTAVLTERLAADAAAYTLGSGHAILQLEDGLDTAPYNRVQVYGAGAYGEDFNWTEVDTIYDNLLQIKDLNISSAANAATRAAAELRRSLLITSRGALTVPPICGLELYDVLTLNEPRLGLANVNRRVAAFALRYDTQRPIYEQEIALALP